MAADIPGRQSLSVASIAEFSEPISETDEIESVSHLEFLHRNNRLVNDVCQNSPHNLCRSRHSEEPEVER